MSANLREAARLVLKAWEKVRIPSEAMIDELVRLRDVLDQAENEDSVESLTLFIGNEARVNAGLEPYKDCEGPGWESCRRLARSLIASGRAA